MNYLKESQCSSLLNKKRFLKCKKEKAKILLYFLYLAFLASVTEVQCIPLKGNPCNCNSSNEIINGIPPNCDDVYITNGCFECYDQFSQFEGNEEPDDIINEYRKYEQFEFAIGAVDWGGIMELRTGTNKFEEGYLTGWYSPTYYTPNYFNADNLLYPKFQTGQNWLNYHIDEKDNNKLIFEYYKRYPYGWTFDNNTINDNGTLNYGYAGFWAEPKKNVKFRSIWNEYIQQKLKKVLSPIGTYKLSFKVSKNHDGRRHDGIGGQQRIGTYFSATAPTYLGYDKNKDKDPQQFIMNVPPYYGDPFKIDYSETGSNLIFTDPIADCADVNGMDGWYQFEKIFKVDKECSFITIGLFNYKDLLSSDTLNKTAYYIDDVHITELEDDCPCMMLVNNSGLDPEAAMDIMIIPKENCCFDFFFHRKQYYSCEVLSANVNITIADHQGNKSLLLTNSSGLNDNFTLGTFCLTDMDKSLFTPTITDFDGLDAIFTFTYYLSNNTSCVVERRIFLPCSAQCTCPALPNPISIVPIPTEPCCYNILLKMNNDSELSNFCRYYKAEVYERDGFTSQPYNKLFEVYPDQSNSFIENGIRYFYPGMEINLTAARKLCYDGYSFPYKSIKIRLYYDEETYCDYVSGIGLNCPISCDDVPPPNPNNFLKCIWIPVSKDPLVTKCKYKLHIINNSGLNVSIPEFKFDFSSIIDTLPEFQRSWLTNFDSIAITFPTSPTYWTYTKDTNNQSISFTTSQMEFVLADGDTLYLADISIPESNEALAVGFNIKNSQHLNSYCNFGEEIISCPTDSVCSCEVSSLLDFALSAKEKETATDPCCYEITLSPPSQYMNCTINEIEVYVKNPNDTIYSIIPDLDTLLLTPLNSKITLSRDFCITPVSGNSSFSVKVKFKNLNFECEKEKTFNFTTCPCACDDDGIDFNINNYPEESCCFNISLNSDCPREFSEIIVGFPPSLDDYIDESYFSSDLYGIEYKKQGNNYVYSPEEPIKMYDSPGIYLGKLSLPPLPDTISRPIALTLTAKDKNGNICKQEIINVNCNGCDSTTVNVINNGGCNWDLIPINNSFFWNSDTNHYCQINDITNQRMIEPENINVLRAESKTLHIEWYVFGKKICEKIITLSCSYAGIGSIAGGNGGIIPKLALPFKEINNGTIENFEFAPNPASDEANIRFDLLKDTKILKLEIYDSKGDIIANIPVVNYIKGQNYINLNTSNIIAGSYYLVLQTENAKMCLPIRIVR